MPTFEDILRIHHLRRIELQAWIEQRWVRPLTTPQGPVFDEADEARIALIRELRQEFEVNDDALEVVLSLLAQIYVPRRVVKRVEAAVGALPEPMRAQIREKLRQAP